MDINFTADKPLGFANALENDKLNRREFAEAAVSALERVSNEAGFVISIEGSWGSGKTSILAMMEQIIRQRSKSDIPIFVHFNPWLVGDRNALLRQFLASISSAMNVKDNVAEAEKAAAALQNYAKVFDFIAYIPGAEPFTGPIRKVIDAASNAVRGVADEKRRDLEGAKLKLEEALISLGKKIYVFIDDIDRLYPGEVYEIVRIVKAVGELPNVGYVLAMDSSYVASALESANVPQSLTFIEKIVQIRLSVPAISVKIRGQLLDQQLATLNSEAFEPYFPGQDERFSFMYRQGARDLIEHPRDIVRVINTLSVVEPSLRGELVFADIFALVTIMVKAPNLYEFLKRQPELFSGASIRSATKEGREAEFKTIERRIDELCQLSSNPNAAKNLIKVMFPRAFGEPFQRISSIEGHISSPDRLAVAIGQSVGVHDVSLVNARKYLVTPASRSSIASGLTKDNSLEFFEHLGEIAQVLDAEQLGDVEGLSLGLAQLLDSLAVTDRLPGRRFFGLDAEAYVRHAIKKSITRRSADEAEVKLLMSKTATVIAADPNAISIAADILFASQSNDEDGDLIADSKDLPDLSQRLSRNVVQSLESGKFWRLTNPARVLWYLARFAQDYWPTVLEAMIRNDPTLDLFALQFLKSSFSSDGGQSYALPARQEIRGAIDVDWLKKHALERVNAPGVGKVARNAWRSVIEGKSIYGESGKEARH